LFDQIIINYHTLAGNEDFSAKSAGLDKIKELGGIKWTNQCAFSFEIKIMYWN